MKKVDKEEEEVTHSHGRGQRKASRPEIIVHVPRSRGRLRDIEPIVELYKT